jgi:hypothetical protein
MAIHAMIDLETGSTRLDCMILTIGIVKFNPVTETIIDTLYIKPSLEEQEAVGRVIDDSTAKWWSEQPSDNTKEAWGDEDRVPWLETLHKVQKFSWGSEYVWSNGASFDIPIICHAMLNHGVNSPWDFYKARDTRTIYEIAKVKLSDDKHVTTHNALEDAIHQTKVLFRAYKKLNALGLELK